MSKATHLISARPVAMTPSPEFTELYETHYAAVYRTALRITGNAADAEDVLQTVFLRVLNKDAQTEYARMSDAYFRRAAANAAIDLLRRRRTHEEVGLAEAPSPVTGGSEVLLKERLRRAVATLDENDAMMFLLRYVEGLSNHELAEMFGIEKNNVAVRLHRIRQALQAEMER